MQTLFDTDAYRSIITRINALTPTSPRQWGKMDPAQMLAHCVVGFEFATGDRRGKQALIGKLLARFVRAGIRGDKPVGKNSPTDKAFIMDTPHDFQVEKERLLAILARFHQGGRAKVTSDAHVFFGKLSADEWSRLMLRHVDHHLKQFGA